MVDVNSIKNGMTLLIEGNIYQVVEFLHVKPGKGSAFMKTKMKNLRTGANLERTFNTNVKFEEARIDRKAVSYLYEAGGTYYFMDNNTYEQYELNEEQIEESKLYLIEGMNVDLTFYGSELLGIKLPEKVEYTIVECEPGIKDSTATAATKVAKTETGLVVRVPMFINEGEKIIITTVDGKYYSRA
ncbi:MAG: elongation factor P [Clostridia bacterium]|nr:elongation factor P [Clostridia bacterium]